MSLNTYGYCYGNPVGLIDRNGHSVDGVLEQLKIKAGAIVVGGSIYIVTTTADGAIKVVKAVAGTVIPNNIAITGGDLSEEEKEQDREDAEESKTGELTRAQKRNLQTLDNMNEHLTDSDFSGTLRDLQGEPVPKPDGGFWNHIGEMQDTYKGLDKIKRGIEGSLKNPNLSDEARQVLQPGLDKDNDSIGRI